MRKIISTLGSAILFTFLVISLAFSQVSNPGVQQQGAVTTNNFAVWAGNRLLKDGGPPSGILDLICTTRGALLYRGAASWACLSPGTNGDALITGGPGADPSWVTVGGTGTVTSVGLSSSGSITVGGTNPVTGSGTITVNLAAGAAATNVGTLGGDLTGTLPNPSLASVITAGGPIGDAVTIPIITYDAKGRLTAVSSAAVAPAFANLPALAQGQLYFRGPAGTGAPGAVAMSSALNFATGCGTNTGTAVNSVFYKIAGGNAGCTNAPLTGQFLGFNGTSTGFYDLPLATTSVNGIVDIATSGEFVANTSGHALDSASVWSAAAPVTVTYGASIALDFSALINAQVTLTGNLTLANPTNVKPGQTGTIRLIQGGSGSYTIAFGTTWKFAGGTAPVLSTAVGAVDYLNYFCSTTTFCVATIIKDAK